ncbi:MAG: precorrin-2 C(20)-methyltransferase [Peptoniphilus sp.]|nr:precorrin-2 C(20)-methyltransferase [Peptoniphilus sp.]MDD7363714.1 precorrin-2 C(20)-methyltransferase [Bacillota bacterium]MDY6044099.1 precorrin-2 C(20)-methyltransferase [Peptoniphilus sp.]
MRKLIGIGVGPGAEDLLTLRAVRALREADHIFVPRNGRKTRAFDIIRDIAGDRDVIFLDFPMGETMDQFYREAFEAIDRATKDGEVSVLATLGDGTIYATLTEVIDAGRKSDMVFELVPGIPAFLAGINGLIETLVEKGESFLLVDALKDDEPLHADCIAILKTREPKKIFDRLRDEGYDAIYLENIETERWAMTRESDRCSGRGAYMSLILARRRPWNTAEILKHTEGRIQLL